MEAADRFVAFAGVRKVADGVLRDVVPVLKDRFDRDPSELVLVFEVGSGRQVDFDLRGPLNQVLERAAPGPRPGRPKLGVTSREVTLLPRHWDWLEQNDTGISGALRRLVEDAMQERPGNERVRRIQAALGRFLTSIAGDRPNYEEATRALFQADAARFEALVARWPKDIRAFALEQMALLGAGEEIRAARGPNEELVRKLYDVVWSRGELDALPRLVAPEYVVHSDPGDAWEGRTLDQVAYRERVEYSRRAFPDLAFTVHEAVAAGERVAVRWSAAGTHAGDLRGFPRTGKRLAFAGQTFYEVKDGRIRGHWQVVDRLGFAEQLRREVPFQGCRRISCEPVCSLGDRKSVRRHRGVEEHPDAQIMIPRSRYALRDRSRLVGSHSRGGVMARDGCACRSACTLAVLVALPVVSGSQGTQAPAVVPYTIAAHTGAEADVEFARRWLDAAIQVMATKYHVVPDQYSMSVSLLFQPENDIDATQSGQNRCCATDGQGRKTGTIFLLGPSAPIWKARALRSSLGLPKDGEDYHAKVLMSEYIPIGHYAVQDARPAGGWRYYSAPSWFVQGLQEYDAIYHTTATNRTQTVAALKEWARENVGRFACCTKGIELGDPYNGGAAFMAFLAAEFGEGVHERILRSAAPTFVEALTSETKPRSQAELVAQFRKWAETK